MFSRPLKVQIPRLLWSRILAAHNQDEALASAALATAILVACDNVATPHVRAHRPLRPLSPPPLCPTCGHAHEPPGLRPLLPPEELLAANPGSYMVQEGVLDGVPADMPVQDPWKGTWS